MCVKICTCFPSLMCCRLCCIFEVSSILHQFITTTNSLSYLHHCCLGRALCARPTSQPSDYRLAVMDHCQALRLLDANDSNFLTFKYHQILSEELSGTNHVVIFRTVMIHLLFDLFSHSFSYSDSSLSHFDFHAL